VPTNAVAVIDDDDGGGGSHWTMCRTIGLTD